jgi:hypothetical protein
MEKQGTTKWIVVLAGALTTVFGLVISAGSVIPMVQKAVNLPECWTYTDVYYAPESYFKRDGTTWREYGRIGNVLWYEFRETHHTRDFIFLLNLTPRPGTDEWRRFTLRFPVCGGTAMMSGIPQKWQDLFEVWREDRSAVR